MKLSSQESFFWDKAWKNATRSSDFGSKILNLESCNRRRSYLNRQRQLLIVFRSRQSPSARGIRDRDRDCTIEGRLKLQREREIGGEREIDGPRSGRWQVWET